jgi:hypothetical protein
MSSFLVLAMPHQIPRLLDQGHRNRRQLLREQTVPERLLNIEIRIIVEELRIRIEELSIPVDGSWKGAGEPVECDVVEDLFERRVCIGPLIEFLTDPRFNLLA